MKLLTAGGSLCFLVIAGLLFVHCDTSSVGGDELSDSAKIANLRKVKPSIDSLENTFGLPAGVSHNSSFTDAQAQDSVEINNLENYTIGMILHLTADNTDEDGGDAKFDGMKIRMVMTDTNGTDLSPIDFIVEDFTVLKGESRQVQGTAEINLLTHKDVGRYIISRSLDGSDLETESTPSYRAEIGAVSETITFPAVPADIPTRTPSNTAFLTGLLDSGMLD